MNAVKITEEKNPINYFKVATGIAFMENDKVCYYCGQVDGILIQGKDKDEVEEALNKICE